MNILVWGIGNYYKKKENNFSKDTIIAYISSKEKGKHKGVDIIEPASIFLYKFDRLYIMTAAVFEILETLKDMNFDSWDKVIFGWNVRPYIEDEELLFEDGELRCNKEGICVYFSKNKIVEIRSEETLIKIKQEKIRNKKKNELVNIPTLPISRIFGIDRGEPIDRYYIEKFLNEYSYCIKGTVLEVAERKYTMAYGKNVEKSYIMHVTDSLGDDSIIVNLETGEGVIDGMMDCFILTQTLPFIFDVKEAVRNAVRFLKKDGVMLVTVSGISQISRYDMNRWGHYWSFTTASLKRLFDLCEDVESVEVKAYGNVKSTAYGLYGLAVEDIGDEELSYLDNDYQQIITAVVRKRN